MNKLKLLVSKNNSFSEYDGTIVLQRSGIITTVNPDILKVFAADDKKEFIGKNITEFLFEPAEFEFLLGQFSKSKKRITCQIEFQNLANTLLSGICTLKEIDKKQIELCLQHVFAVLPDVSPVSLSDASLKRLQHLTHVVQSLRNMNRLVTQKNEKYPLVQQVCEILTTNYDIYSAWILLVDQSLQFEHFAHSQLGDYVQDFCKMLEKNNFPSCVSLSFQQSKVLVFENPIAACGDCIGAKHYKERGAFAVRIAYDDAIFGTLVLSIPKQYLKANEYLELVKELADNVGLALYHIQTRQQNRALEKVVDALPNPVAHLSRNYRYLAVNDVYEKLFGVPKKEIIGQSIKAFFGKELFDKGMKSKFDECLTGKTVNYELFLELQNKVRWMLVTYSPYYDKDGNVTGVLSHAFDITERKNVEEEFASANQQLAASEQQLLANEQQLEQKSSELQRAYSKSEKQRIANLVVLKDLSRTTQKLQEEIKQRENIAAELRRNELRYQKAQELGHVGNWEFELQTGNFWGSDEAKRIYGFSSNSKEFTTDEVENCIPERERVHQALVDLIEKNKPYDLEFDIISMGNKMRKTIHSMALLEKDAQGNPFKVTGVIQDITKQKLAEKKIKENEAQLQAIFDNSINAIVIADDERNIIKANAAATLMFGLPMSEFIGMNLNSFYAKGKNNAELKYNEYMEKGYEVGEFTFTDAKGFEKTSQYHAVRIRENFHLSILTDTTVRKQAEQRIKQEKEFNRKIIDFSPAFVMLIEQHGKVKIMNKAMEQAIGYVMQQLQLQEFLKPMLDDGAFKNISDFWKNSTERQVFENTLLTKDGESIIVEWHASLLKNDAKESDGLLLIGNDITERKANEQKILRLLHDQQILLENDPSFIIYKDTQNKILRVTQTVADMTGMPREEIEGRPSIEIYPSMAEEYYKDDLEVMNSRQPKMGIVEKLPTVDGGIKWLLTNKVPVIEHDQVTGIIVFSTDITDLQRSREQLKESEERFTQAMNASQDGLFDWNLQTNEIYYSPGWKKMLGYEYDELPNDFSVWANTTAPQDVEKSWEMQKKLVNKEIDRFEVEFKMKHKDGHWVDVLSRAKAIFDENGQAVRMIGTHVDITDRKKAEREKQDLQKQLLQSQKLEAVGQLTGGVAHDFNNLLTIIIGNTQLMELDMEDDNPFWANVKNISDASLRAAKLTKQLLLFSRKESMLFKPLNLNESILDVLTMLHRLIGEDIQIHTELEQNLWLIDGDETNLEQVLMNLAVNARDAMPNGGNLYLSTKNKIVTEEDTKYLPFSRAGRFVCLSIQDTGFGMDYKTQEKIFEPFYTTKKFGQGSGMGLSVVYGIIKKHKGWINVKSEPGKGAIFEMFFPTSLKETPNNKDEKLPENLKGRDELILLIEDELEVLMFGKNLLEKNHYRVDIALDAASAIDLYKKNKDQYALIISDVVLPDMDGVQLVEELLKIKSGVPVIMCSGYTKEKSQVETIKAKKYPFIQKPYLINEMLYHVNKILADKKSKS